MAYTFRGLGKRLFSQNFQNSLFLDFSLGEIKGHRGPTEGTSGKGGSERRLKSLSHHLCSEIVLECSEEPFCGFRPNVYFYCFQNSFLFLFSSLGNKFVC